MCGIAQTGLGRELEPRLSLAPIPTLNPGLSARRLSFPLLPHGGGCRPVQASPAAAHSRCGGYFVERGWHTDLQILAAFPAA